jgi:TIR domain-containing protein
MAGSIPPATSGRIFISYRREETAYPAGWLYDRLAGHFGGQVFKDVDSIELGDDFVEVITRAVGSCDVLLALIGDEWLTITDEHGRRRLDNPDDFVRLEIEAALSRRVRLIPILVGGARMPRADELPDSLAALVRRQALELSPARFDFDTSRLLNVLDRTLAEVRATQQDAPAPAGTAPDLSPTAPPEPPEQREQAGRSPTPGIPPVAPATPAERSPSEADKPQHKRRRRLSARARVLAGAGAGVVLILVIVAIVANSGTTPPSTGASTPTPSPANEVIFQDDFSSQASEWGPYDPGTGRYTNGAYLISAPPSAGGGGEGASPGKASGVYPSAPPNIRIEVQGRRLPASDQSMEYGIACRIHGDNAYVLTISDNYASIEKYGRYKLLKENAQFQVNANSTNRLQAMCASVKGKQAVHLELWVNGRKAVETTDTDNPLPTGTVGLVVGTDQTKRVSVAEFDNFTVSRL